MSNIYKLNQKGDETIMLKNNSELFEELSDRQSEMLSGGIAYWISAERTFRSTSSCVDEAFLSFQQAGLNPQVTSSGRGVFAVPDNNNIVGALCSDSLNLFIVQASGSSSLNTQRTRVRNIARFYA